MLANKFSPPPIGGSKKKNIMAFRSLKYPEYSQIFHHTQRVPTGYHGIKNNQSGSLLMGFYPTLEVQL